MLERLNQPDLTVDSVQKRLVNPIQLSHAVYTFRGIAILRVVAGHIASPFTQFIFSFHMPLFFILSD